jgi:hypothetical protein
MGNCRRVTPSSSGGQHFLVEAIERSVSLLRSEPFEQREVPPIDLPRRSFLHPESAIARKISFSKNENN